MRVIDLRDWMTDRKLPVLIPIDDIKSIAILEDNETEGLRVQVRADGGVWSGETTEDLLWRLVERIGWEVENSVPLSVPPLEAPDDATTAGDRT